MSFSVFYQVYRNKIQTEIVLFNFRKFHPDIKINLISDGGDDFTDLAKKYNCDYTYDIKNLGYYDHKHPDVIFHRSNNNTGGHVYGWNKNESDVYIKRFLNFCEKNNSEYIFLLEDDVYVNSYIDISQINCDITFANFNNSFNEQTLNYLKNKNINCKIFGWGMCGGNFIKRKQFIDGYYKTWEKLKFEYDDIYSNIFSSIGFQDVLFSLIISELNPIVNINPYYSESDSFATIYHSRAHRR